MFAKRVNVERAAIPKEIIIADEKLMKSFENWGNYRFTIKVCWALGTSLSLFDFALAISSPFPYISGIIPNLINGFIVPGGVLITYNMYSCQQHTVLSNDPGNFVFSI